MVLSVTNCLSIYSVFDGCCVHVSINHCLASQQRVGTGRERDTVYHGIISTCSMTMRTLRVWETDLVALMTVVLSPSAPLPLSANEKKLNENEGNVHRINRELHSA